VSRPWLRWAVLTLFVVALAVTFVNLGQWQLDRLDQRRASNATVVAHENAPVVAYEEVFDHEITDADAWQRVTVTGTFDAQHQLQVRYRTDGQNSGWELVTPLLASDGRTVLVNRGFVVRPASQDFPRDLPAPPAGEVRVVGFVQRNEQGKANAVTPNVGTVRLINSDAIGAWLGREVVNGYIGLISVTPAQSAELTPIRPPVLDEGPHLSYALQWFAFTAIAGVGLGVLIRNDLNDKKKARARAARQAAGAATPDAAEPAGAGPAPATKEH